MVAISEKITSIKNYTYERYASAKNYLGKPVTWVKEVEWKKGGTKLYETIKLVIKTAVIILLGLVFLVKAPIVLAPSMLLGYACPHQVKAGYANILKIADESHVAKVALGVVAFAALAFTIQAAAAVYGSYLTSNHGAQFVPAPKA